MIPNKSPSVTGAFFNDSKEGITLPSMTAALLLRNGMYARLLGNWKSLCDVLLMVYGLFKRNLARHFWEFSLVYLAELMFQLTPLGQSHVSTSSSLSIGYFFFHLLSFIVSHLHLVEKMSCIFFQNCLIFFYDCLFYLLYNFVYIFCCCFSLTIHHMYFFFCIIEKHK